MSNRLILIGNGFDLAHGLKTTYKDFLDWYMRQAFQIFIQRDTFQDELLEMKNKYHGLAIQADQYPNNVEETLRLFEHTEYRSISYKSTFFREIILEYNNRNYWVDIECFYFKWLKRVFASSLTMDQKRIQIQTLNRQFDYLIERLQEYFIQINEEIRKSQKT